MNPLILPLARLAANLGMNLIELLRAQGASFTNEELIAYRNESQRTVDLWNTLAPKKENS